MVLISNPRESVPLMAQSSFKKKVIGDAARMLKASKSKHTLWNQYNGTYDHG